ncbi:hypothetical protein BH23VER1_BH23VER1_15740 [soil metagenome]
MDRTAWIVVTLCTVALIAYFVTAPQPPPPQRTAPPVTAPGAADDRAAPGVEGVAGREPALSAPAVEEMLAVLRNDVATYTFTNLGGGLRSVELLAHKGDYGGLVTLNEHGRAPIGALSRIAGEPEEALAYAVVAGGEGTASITYEAVTPENLTVRKTYTIRRTGDDAQDSVVEMDLELRNQSEAPVTSTDYFVYAGALGELMANDFVKPSVCWFADGSAEEEDIGYFGDSKILFFRTGSGKSMLVKQMPDIRWAGVHNQFFATLLSPADPLLGEVWGGRSPVTVPFPEAEEGTVFYAAEGGLGLPARKVEVAETLPYHFEIYAGPRSYTKLASLGNQRAEVMFYGWFRVISQVLMRMLVAIEAWVGNYGIAIMIITVIIRIVLWPLYSKSQRTMKRMALLSPKMTELREKYKDNPQKQQQELMALYKDYGVNPFGGCFPMLLQIPIFFGFYRMLQSAVELRGENFLWVRDLAAPDTVATFPGTDFPINPLPILMGLTMVLQMAIAPKSGDKTQQRMFMFMPIIFLVICSNFASGLSLYWTTQNIFSIGQTWLAQRAPEPALEKKKPKQPLPPPGAAKRKTAKPKPARTGGGGARSAKKKP